MPEIDAENDKFMIDPQRTIGLLTGALLRSKQTWSDYFPDAGNWQKTLVQITVPMIVISVIGAYVLGLVITDTSFFGRFKPTLTSSLINIAGGLSGVGLLAVIFSVFAGVFGGKNRFAFGFAAVSLTLVPAYFGQLLTWLPWIGGLLSIGLSIYSMVLLWRAIPLYLEVPDGKRAVHYAVSLLVSIAVMFVVSIVMMPSGSSGMPGSTTHFDSSDDIKSSLDGLPPGIIRDAMLVQQAQNEQYTPPQDGKLTESQIDTYIAVMTAASRKRKEIIDGMRAIQVKTEAGNDISMADMATMMNNSRNVSGMGTAEMDAVIAAGGNWAEHNWVQRSLRDSEQTQDGTDAGAHNYRLYQQYKEAIDRAVNVMAN